ncbi:death-associated inhibitor of apoptosis 1-like isoform X1 [Arctopsyche grandis]|uniref:death-associated inhibitor of apoptosis 1-like isoform X1 n=2 Tax=Arctopsyche grandis TaxID=121162 RepID=UPI00406D876E
MSDRDRVETRPCASTSSCTPGAPLQPADADTLIQMQLEYRRETLEPANRQTCPEWKNLDALRLAKPASRDHTDHGKAAGTTANLPDRAGARAPDPIPQPDLRREADRLATLEHWPVAYLDKSRIARTGLYYFGVGDKVRCYSCNLELGEWEEGDDPAVDHERCMPLCKFLRGEAHNIPLFVSNSATTSNNSAPPPVGQDVCGPCNLETQGPVRPAFASEPARLASFKDWPCRMKQRPEVMADAGFFYTGSGDKTVCYYCGGGLKDWEDDDDPWEQHARWFPTCHYIQLIKGDSYVQSVRSKPSERTNNDHTESTPCDVTPAAVATKASTASSDESSGSSDKSESSLCKICFSAERNICFVPCGHVVACPKCALAVQVCPVCRQQFTSTMRLYYS